jgi:hypothetical protein
MGFAKGKKLMEKNTNLAIMPKERGNGKRDFGRL